MIDNFSFLFQYLKKENIAIDQIEFDLQIQSHSDFPSLLAISDTLSFFNVPNLATKINFEDIVHLPKNFIALLKYNNKQFFALIEKEGSSFKYKEDNKSKKVSENEFQNIFQNIILLAEKEETNISEAKMKNSLYFLLPIIAFLYITILLISGANSKVVLFSFLSIIGIYFSIEVIFKELGVRSKFSESVCNITSSVDCDKVIKSKGIGFLEKFNYSNFGVTFFVTQLLLLFVLQLANKTNDFFEIQFALLLCSILVTFLSIYHQVKIAKKWCPICLLIIGLLYTEIIFVYFTNPILLQFDFLTIIIFIILFSLTYFLTDIIKSVFKIKNEQQEELVKIYRFKRNFELFELALNESEKANITMHSKSLIVGNPNANLKITLITNPFCSFCKEAHKIIEKIYRLYKDDVCINFYFNYNSELTNENSKKMHSAFLQIYFNEDEQSFLDSLHNWFEKDVVPLAKKEVISELQVNEILHNQFLSNQENKLNFTPCFIINDAVFPKMYERNDLIYFIPELISKLENI